MDRLTAFSLGGNNNIWGMKMYPYEFKLSLRVTHPSIDPEMICSELGWHPSVLWKAGANIENPKGKPLGGKRKETYCSFDLGLPKRKSSEFEYALKYWNRELANHKEFLRRIRTEGGAVEYFVGLFIGRNSGITLDRDLLRGLVDLGIEVLFDVYGSELVKRKSTVA